MQQNQIDCCINDIHSVFRSSRVISFVVFFRIITVIHVIYMPSSMDISSTLHSNGGTMATDTSHFHKYGNVAP